MNLLSVKKMAIKLNKKNPIAKNLFTKKFFEVTLWLELKQIWANTKPDIV